MRHALRIALACTMLGAPASRAADDGYINDPTLLSELHAAILAFDYVCPAVKMAKPKDSAAEGTRIKVWCGPSDRDGVYEKLIYIVTVRPSGRIQVEKSSVFGR